MRVVVTGSREWTDTALLRQVLDDLHVQYGIEVLFHGDQRGADTLAKQWCLERGIPVFGCPYPPAYGKTGGSTRNGWLLKYGLPDLVVAFPMKNSVGTWNCVTQARGLNLRIRTVRNHVDEPE